MTGNWRGPCRARFPPVTGTGCAAPGRLRLAPLPPSGPVTVQRRVSSRGGIMVATQKIQVGLIHAGKIVTVTAEDHSFRLVIDGQAVGVVPRTTTREIHRYKAYAAHPRPGRR